MQSVLNGACGRIHPDALRSWHTVAVPFSADARSAIIRGVREHRVLLSWLLAAAALAGCTSDPPPKGDTSTPTLTTYSPPSYATAKASTPPITTGPNVRPGEKPPTFPQTLNTNDRVAADVYAKYWMQTLDWGYATTDSTLARQAFLPACRDCERFIQIFDDARSAGEHFRGGRISFEKSAIQPNDHRNGANAVSDVTVSVAALQTLDSKDRVIKHAPAIRRVSYRIWMRWAANRWYVVDWKEAVSK
jgi:hypothetical protein